MLARLLDKLPGVDQLLANPQHLLIAVCAGALCGVVLVIVL